jgi:hypothetical protein
MDPLVFTGLNPLLITHSDPLLVTDSDSLLVTGVADPGHFYGSGSVKRYRSGSRKRIRIRIPQNYTDPEGSDFSFSTLLHVESGHEALFDDFLDS